MKVTSVEITSDDNEDNIYSHSAPTAEIRAKVYVEGFGTEKFAEVEIEEPFDKVECHKKKVPSFEEILEELGCFGPFQVLTLCSYLFLEIAAAFVVFIPVFVGKGSATSKNCSAISSDDEFADIHKYSVGNETENSFLFTSFSSLVDDVHHVFESPFKYHSVVDEWDLTCDRAWIPDVFTSCLMAGMIVGNVIASQMADWYGRRRTYLIILILMFLGTTMSALSPNIYSYAFARFVTGAGFCGFINVSCMAVMEFMTPKWRSLANCIGPMGEGIILLSIIGYFVRPWRLLYLVTLVPYVLIIPIFLVLPESPRWLLRNKQMKEAYEVLAFMAKVNGRTPVSMEVLEEFRKQEELNTESQKKKRIGYVDFIKSKELFTTSLYLFAIWFSWNVGYYGISYNIRNVPGNPYFNLGLAGLANAIGQRVSMPTSDCMGRRRSVLFGMTLSAAFLVALAACFLAMEEVNSSIILVGCFFGLFGLANARASARLLSGESFPTAVRTMGLGFGGLGANFAGLVTPQIAYLGSVLPSLPFFIFAVVSVMGSLVVFMMKETNGNPLSDEVQTNKGKSKDTENKLGNDNEQQC